MPYVKVCFLIEYIFTFFFGQANNISGATDKQGSNMRLDRYADLLDRQKLMMNSVMLRQNPHNCVEWQKRVELYEGKPTMVRLFVGSIQVFLYQTKY